MNSEQKRINFNEMVAGYINCALCVDADDRASKFTWLHLSGEALAVATVNCQKFINSVVIQGKSDFLETADWSKLGHDFWLTRNGHGSGFFDGDYEYLLGELLTDIAQSSGESYLYLGDDDYIYIA